MPKWAEKVRDTFSILTPDEMEKDPWRLARVLGIAAVVAVVLTLATIFFLTQIFGAEWVAGLIEKGIGE